MATGFALSFVLPIVFSLCLMVGVAIAARGIIGLPVWRAPRCASCGHGIAPRPESLRSPCPECGADLTRSGGIHYFDRQRRYGRVVAGAAVIASIFVVLILVQLILRMTMQGPVGPSTSTAELAKLIRENGAYEPGAISEAASRANANTLSNEDLAAILDAMRSPEGEEGNRYPKLGELDLLLEGRRRQLIDEEDLVDFGRGFTVPPSLGIPDTFRPPFSIGIPSFSTDQMNSFSRSVDVTKIEIDGVEVPILDYQGTRLPRVRWGSYGQISVDGEPGPHTLRVTYEETFTFAPDSPGSPLAPAKVVANLVVESPLTYVAAGAPTWIKTASPASRRPEVIAACVAGAVAIDPDRTGEGATLRASFQVHPVKDIGLAFDVVVRLDEPSATTRESIVGSVCIVAFANSTTTWGPVEQAVTLTSIPNPLPTTVTVLFRPNPALAESIVGVKEVWGEEVLVTNVPVRGPTAGSTTPASGGAR